MYFVSVGVLEYEFFVKILGMEIKELYIYIYKYLLFS